MLPTLPALCHELARSLVLILLLILLEFALVTTSQAQTPTVTFQGRVMYSTGQAADGAVVTLTKTVNGVVSTSTQIASGGSYTFTENKTPGQCTVSYQFQAVSLELVDDEQLPPSGTISSSGCLPDNVTNADLVIQRPHPITLGGIVKDTKGVPVQGVTVTMTRTKYNLNPNVVTTAQTITDAGGHYQFTTFSRCSVVEEFRASYGTFLFRGSLSTSGCVLTDNNTLNLSITFGNGLADAGVTGCNKSVGRPVNVVNGNMYLSQPDYYLPGAGEAIVVTRTYNSLSQQAGLFGLGWTTQYDETVTVDANNYLQLRLADGRVVGVTTPDFYGQITKNANGTYTVVFKNGIVHQFNSSGKLVSQTDRNGNQTTLTYNASGRLASVTDPFGRVLVFNTNANGRVTSIADSIGTVASYTYSANQLLSVTYADNSAFQFSYSTVPGGLALATVTDALGNVIEHHDYDSQGRATTSEISGGVEKYTLAFVSPGETDVTDALGHVTKYFFHRSLDRYVVTRVEGTCGCGSSQIKSWTYDDRGNATSITDALNHTRSYTYDNLGNRLTETDATGTVTYTYNQFGQVLTRTDQMSGVTTNTFDSNGNLLTSKDALNNTTAFTHDSRGQLLTITNARNKVTTFSWNTSGQLTQIQDALNHNTNFVYDARARLTALTNALNQTTSREYDPAGRLKKIIYPDANFVQYTYDLAGRRTKVKDPRGNETNFAYDNAYRLTSVTDALSDVSSYAYDLMSNVTSASDPLGRVTNFEYDDFNRLKKMIYPAATVGATRLEELITYDSGGNVTKRTDTAGRDTSYLYDSVDRMIQITDPALQITKFRYNARSQRVAIIDALNQTYSFVYDALGHLTQSTRGSASMSYAYDAVGNPIQRTDFNGAITNYSYDDLNRLTEIFYPNSTSAGYEYDALSRLTSASNENGTVAFSYDNRGRVSSTTDVWGQTLGFGYDANGNRTSLSLGGASQATYEYDELNRLKKITDNGALHVDYAYDAGSRLISGTLPNGVSTSYAFDGLSRLTQLRDVKGLAEIASREFQYNTASQITQLTDPEGVHVYGYDNVDRLTSASHSNEETPAESYGYDAVGNRTSTGLDTYDYDPFNRLISAGSTGYFANYSHDANGNILSKSLSSVSQTYSYDFENRLTSAQVSVAGGPPTQTTVVYKYDALGRRIERSPGNGGTTRFVYDGDDVVEDLDSSGAVTTRYLNGPGIDNKLRQQNVQTGATHYFVTDHLGSTRSLTDTSGNVVEQLSYDSFGNSVGSATTRYDYTGRERDDVTGLLYFRARFYDPAVGRFTSEDPIGFAGGINQYSYVGGNPISFIDSLGLQPDGPVNALRNPLSVDHWFINGASNTASDFLGLDAVAQEAWDLGDPCLSDGARAWAGGKLAARVILVAASGPIARVAGRLGSAALNRFAPGLASRLSGPISELLTGGAAKTIDPAVVRFSQSSISRNFSSGGAIEDLAAGLRNGSVNPANIPPIRLVEREGNLFTLDNRRLWSFQQAETPVPFRMATPQEVANEAWKFTTQNGGTSIRVRGQ